MERIKEIIEKDKIEFIDVLKENVFSDLLISKWIKIKRREFEEVERRPHLYEFLIYF